MKAGQIWKCNTELEKIKESEDFWHNDGNGHLFITPACIHLIEYEGEDIWRVHPVSLSSETQKQKEKHDNDSMLKKINIDTKFVVEYMELKLLGKIIHKYYTHVGSDLSGYGPEPMYEMIFPRARKEK